MSFADDDDGFVTLLRIGFADIFAIVFLPAGVVRHRTKWQQGHESHVPVGGIAPKGRMRAESGQKHGPGMQTAGPAGLKEPPWCPSTPTAGAIATILAMG